MRALRLVLVAVAVMLALGAASAPTAHLYVLINPNRIVEIDAQTNKVLRDATVTLAGGGRWAYNDDNNYFDGKNIWLTTRNNDGAANDLIVVAVNVETMKVTGSFPIGSGDFNPFIGKASKEGILPVATRDLGKIVTIDTRAMKILNTFDVPLAIDPSGKLLYKKDLPPDQTVGEGDVVCDVDVVTLADGREVAVYPTQASELVIAVDLHTGAFVSAGKLAPGSKGNMLSTSPLNRMIWPQENNLKSQAVMDPDTMKVITRFPTAGTPAVNSFSPDGRITYVNGGGTATTVIDTVNYKVLANVQVGANAAQSVAHPDGKVVYTLVSQELAVAVIDTATWRVTGRIQLPANGNSMFILPNR